MRRSFEEELERQQQAAAQQQQAMAEAPVQAGGMGMNAAPAMDAAMMEGGGMV